MSAVPNLYDMLVRSFDPLTMDQLEEALTKWEQAKAEKEP
jgi:hypothetical protein